MLVKTNGKKKSLLSEDKAYVVMAITYGVGGGIFKGVGVLCSQTEDHRSQYFEDIEGVDIIDSTLPSYWQAGFDGKDFVLSFPEMVNDLGRPGHPGFYERYLEDDYEALRTMEKYYKIECDRYKDQTDLYEGQ